MARDHPVAPASPLSPQERFALRRGSRTRLPAALVLVSLLSLVVLPVLTQRRIDRLRSEIGTIAEPARAQVTEIRIELALEAAARRGYLLTADRELAVSVRDSRARRRGAEQALVAGAPRLDAGVSAAVAELAARLAAVDRHLDSVFSGGVSRAAYAAAMGEQQERFDAALASAARVAAAIGRAADARHRAIIVTERLDVALTVALVVLALAAAFLVAHLGRSFRALALRLDESEARFRQIAENVSDVIWLSDPDVRGLLYVNTAYERVWGRARESAYADSDAMLRGIHPEDRERVLAARSATPDGGYDVEFRVERPDGAVRWVWARGFPVYDERGRVFRVAGITEDVTERRQHELERERLLDGERRARSAAEQRQQELERVTESRARLLRGFTHDVKNPLGAADGFLALLEEGVLGALAERQRDSVARVRRSIGHALDLIAQLLEIARAESGQLELRCGPTHVDHIARDVAEEFRAQAEAKALALAIELSPELPVVESDPGRVRQVVANLVSNAVKYTPPGGQIVVRAAVRPDGAAPEPGQRIAVEVSDTGPGIPEERMPLLFLEFTRFDPRAAQGAGIGLAISQKIAAALGGEIAVESEVGAGSTFTLYLPLTGTGVALRR